MQYGPFERLSCGAGPWQFWLYLDPTTWNPRDPDWRFIYTGPAYYFSGRNGGYVTSLDVTGRSRRAPTVRPLSASGQVELFVGEELVISRSFSFAYTDGTPIDRSCNFARAELKVTKKPTTRRGGSIQWRATPEVPGETKGPATLLLKSGSRTRTFPVTLQGNTTTLSVPRLPRGTWTAQVIMPTNDVFYETTSGDPIYGRPLKIKVRR